MRKAREGSVVDQSAVHVALEVVESFCPELRVLPKPCDGSAFVVELCRVTLGRFSELAFSNEAIDDEAQRGPRDPPLIAKHRSGYCAADVRKNGEVSGFFVSIDLVFSKVLVDHVEWYDFSLRVFELHLMRRAASVFYPACSAGVFECQANFVVVKRVNRLMSNDGMEDARSVFPRVLTPYPQPVDINVVRRVKEPVEVSLVCVQCFVFHLNYLKKKRVMGLREYLIYSMKEYRTCLFWNTKINNL